MSAPPHNSLGSGNTARGCAEGSSWGSQRFAGLGEVRGVGGPGRKRADSGADASAGCGTVENCRRRPTRSGGEVPGILLRRYDELGAMAISE